MELEDLKGTHLLTGVDEDIIGPESVAVVRFVLDGDTYIAEENDVDGYRSEMHPLKKDNRVKVKNIFAPIEVLCRHIECGEFYGAGDVMEMIDLANGETVLMVGTENIDDYYPAFIGNWFPERMACNKLFSGEIEDES